MDLLCVGDVALAEEGLSQWAVPGETAPGEHARILFNWELPIGDTINPIPRASGPRLLAHPDSPRVIGRWSPGFAALATNHILDAGEEGLANTIRTLTQAGFTTLGAGQIRDEITTPLIWETAEGRLAIINWVFPETHPDWMAVPGPNCWPGTKEAGQTIGDLKCTVDWVLVVVHWSDELFSYPRPEDRAVARELARMGADLVIGHHPHVVRGMEIIGDCAVFYSIGDFFFSDIPDDESGWVSKRAPRNREGLAVRASFRRGQRPECELLSFWQTQDQSIVDPARRAARRLEQVSRVLQVVHDADYTRWYALKRSRYLRWAARWHFGVRRLGARGTMRRLMQRLLSCL